MWISFQIVPHNKEKIGGGWGGGGGEDLNKNRLFFLHESFTGTKKKLLIEAKKLAKGLHYKFQGYTINGHIRVKKS